MRFLRNHFGVLLATLTLFSLASCGTAEQVEIETAVIQEAAADLDLTLLSDAEIISELHHITENPGDYLGQMIRIRGQCQTYYSDVMNTEYHVVSVDEANSQHTHGLEYTLADGLAYPADGTEATITGKLAWYQENGYTYFHLVHASAVATEETA